MIIGERIRQLREQKGLSQGEIRKRSGLLHSYLSRVENGHTIPSVETLEKLACALEVPLYQLFYEGQGPAELPNLPGRKTAEEIVSGSIGEEARFLRKLLGLLGRIKESDRRLLIHMAQKMARH